MGNARAAGRRTDRVSRKDLLRQADALDLRRQRQINNQIDSLTRVLADRDAAVEIATLQNRVAALEVALEEATNLIGNLASGDSSEAAIRIRDEAREAWVDLLERFALA